MRRALDIGSSLDRTIEEYIFGLTQMNCMLLYDLNVTIFGLHMMYQCLDATAWGWMRWRAARVVFW